MLPPGLHPSLVFILPHWETIFYFTLCCILSSLFLSFSGPAFFLSRSFSGPLFFFSCSSSILWFFLTRLSGLPLWNVESSSCMITSSELSIPGVAVAVFAEVVSFDRFFCFDSFEYCLFVFSIFRSFALPVEISRVCMTAVVPRAVDHCWNVSPHFHLSSHISLRMLRKVRAKIKLMMP